MLNSKDIQEQLRFWNKPSVKAQLLHCATLQEELNLVVKKLATEQQAITADKKYFEEMSVYIDNLKLRKQSMENFIEKKENHKQLTNILRFSMLMERVFNSLAKPWSIEGRKIDLSLDPKTQIMCDVFSDMPKLKDLHDELQKMIVPMDKISAEQQCVIDFARLALNDYTKFISTRTALQKIAAGPDSIEFLARCNAMLNGAYRDYDTNLPNLLARTRGLSSRVCGMRNELAYTIRVSEAQFKKMEERHGTPEKLEAEIIEERKVLKDYEVRLQKVKTLEDEIAELQLRLDFALGKSPVYVTQLSNAAARAA